MPVGPSLEDRDPRRSGKTSGRTGSGPAKAGRRNGRAGRGASSGGGRSMFWLVRTALGLGLFCVLVAIAGLVGMFSYYGSDPKLPTLKRARRLSPEAGHAHPRPQRRAHRRARHREAHGRSRTSRSRSCWSTRWSPPRTPTTSTTTASTTAAWCARSSRTCCAAARAQGGSTITQQVVKTFLLSPERTHAAQGAGDHPGAAALAEALEGGGARAST